LSYDFTQKTTIFLLHQSKALDQDFQWFLVDVWVQKLTPNQPISDRDPAIASIISFICVPHKNLQRHQPTPPSAENIPLICSWFELSVCMVSAPGVVG
jgi:hypothetical protein